ncbi:MAG: hypothetical protein Q8S54_11700 [Bacteroidota bacterium]|nr:hypothetical protein [Bacteroidota bacterium]
MEKKNQFNLAEIGKAAKVAFLKKLQSKKFTLGGVTDQMQKQTFVRVPSGFLYRCIETGEQKTRQEIEAMETNSLLLIEIVSDLKDDPKGYELVNLQCANCLDSILQPLS